MHRPVLVVGGLLATAFAFSAQAEPIGVKLSWTSQDSTSSTMVVSWVTSTNVDTVAEYGVLTVGEHTATGAAPVEFPGIGWVHELELTGLRANTVYKYRVGSPGDYSQEYRFITAPDDQCQAFTFVALGDARSQFNQGPSPNWPGIHSEAGALEPRFIVNTGDLVRDGGDLDQWANWLDASKAINPLVPMLPTIGNHDDGPGEGDGANYNRLFPLPRNTVTGTEDYYYLVYNNLVIFSLSSQTYEDFQAQADWMKGVSAQHPNKWKIVFFHHPLYTSETFGAGHPPNEQGQNPAWGPAFDESAIDLIAMGHNHHYERFRPLRYNAADPEQGQEVSSYGTGPGEGRLYVISGGAGSFTNPLVEYLGAGSAAVGSEVRDGAHHFVKVTVNGNTLHYSAVTTNAGNAGGGGDVIDQVTLTRPGVDPCAGGTDLDGDGFSPPQDCNDADETINPGAAEQCGNTVDEDCNGTAEECPPPLPDNDQDGSPVDSDCDDNDPERFPENPEVECDGIDNDCDCLEVCSGSATNVCAPPDAGAGQDAAPAADVAPAAPDAGAVLPDAGAETEGDAGAAPTPTDEGCGCALAPVEERPSPGWALAPLALLLARRRRAR